MALKNYAVRSKQKMSSLLQKMEWRTYHFVHSHGLVADIVYRVAFHVQRLKRSLSYRSVSRDTVTPEELLREVSVPLVLNTTSTL